MIAAGIGFSNACETRDIIAAIKAAASKVGIDVSDISCLCTDVSKSESEALHTAAMSLNMPVVFFDATKLAQRNEDTITRSERVVALKNLPSVSETAALIGAGPRSRLLSPRVIYGLATCAIAISENSI